MEPEFEACAKTIIPPWHDDANDGPAKQAWRAVRTLMRQRDELVTIFPKKKAELDAQFNAEVLKQARAVHDALFDLTA